MYEQYTAAVLIVAKKARYVTACSRTWHTVVISSALRATGYSFAAAMPFVLRMLAAEEMC